MKSRNSETVTRASSFISFNIDDNPHALRAGYHSHPKGKHHKNGFAPQSILKLPLQIALGKMFIKISRNRPMQIIFEPFRCFQRFEIQAICKCRQQFPCLLRI